MDANVPERSHYIRIYLGEKEEIYCELLRVTLPFIKFVLFGVGVCVV